MYLQLVVLTCHLARAARGSASPVALGVLDATLAAAAAGGGDGERPRPTHDIVLVLQTPCCDDVVLRTPICGRLSRPASSCCGRLCRPARAESAATGECAMRRSDPASHASRRWGRRA